MILGGKDNLYHGIRLSGFHVGYYSDLLTREMCIYAIPAARDPTLQPDKGWATDLFDKQK
jgi:hypothetical protein